MKFGNLHTRHHILQSILNGYASSENHTSDPELLDQWIFLQVETALAHLGTCGSDEACALMAIAERYGADFFMKRYGAQLMYGSAFSLTLPQQSRPVSA